MATKYCHEVEIISGKGRKKPDEKAISEQEMVKGGICSWMYWGGYEKGSCFSYPDEAGKLCPWLLPLVHHVIHILKCGGTLPWTYPGTPYEKNIDKDGITTEYLRCMDPTDAGIVVKITRYPG